MKQNILSVPELAERNVRLQQHVYVCSEEPTDCVFHNVGYVGNRPEEVTNSLLIGEVL